MAKKKIGRKCFHPKTKNMVVASTLTPKAIRDIHNPEKVIDFNFWS
jgi:hypothetical protein